MGLYSDRGISEHQQLQTWRRYETQMLYQLVEGVDTQNVGREQQHLTRSGRLVLQDL